MLCWKEATSFLYTSHSSIRLLLLLICGAALGSSKPSRIWEIVAPGTKLSTAMDKKDILALPPPEKLREIAAKQDERAKEIRARRAQQLQQQKQSADPNEQARAAEVIQRNFRGYRDRRALQGYGLDPSTRWLEV